MDVFVKDGEEYAPLPETHLVLEKTELAKSYFTKEQRDAAITKAVNDRFASHLHKDSAHENETVIARVLEKQKPADTNEDELRQQWDAAHLAPEVEKREAAEARAEALAARVKLSLLAPVLEEAGFDSSFVTRPDPSKPSPAEIYVGEKFGLDENTSLVVEGSAVTPADYAAELIAMDAYSAFRAPDKVNSQGGGKPGQDNSGADKGGPPLTQSSLEGPDLEAYILTNGMVKPKTEGAIPYMDLPK